MIELVYECGINANGDLNLAKRMIDVASAAGCHYVKFQKRTIDLVYTKEELDKPRESPWGTTTREQKEGLEFSDLDYAELGFYCQQKGIQWFASPWDIQSLRFILQRFEVPFIKIPSALLTDKKLLKEAGDCHKPIILSTGMSDLPTLDEAINIIGPANIYAILHCTSTYPTKPEESNTKCITTMKELYPWTKIGFSNHYPGLMSMIMAVALGAEMIEFHGTLDRSMYGSDQAASIEPKGVFELVERIKLIEKMRGDGIKKIYDSELPIMAKLRR